MIAPRKLASASQRIVSWVGANHIPPEEALALLNDVRMSLAALNEKAAYPNLSSYCDLLVHEQIDSKLHFHRLIAASDALRGVWDGWNGKTEVDLYEPIYGSVGLKTELSELLKRFSLSKARDYLESYPAKIISALFRNLHGHSITCEPKCMVDDRISESKLRALFGADSVFVTKINFNLFPQEGELEAQLTVYRPLSDDFGPVKIVFPTTMV